MVDKRERLPKLPEQKKAREKVAEQVEEARERLRDERKQLDAELKEEAKVSGFSNWLEKTWVNLKEKFSGVWEWLKGLFAGKKQEESGQEEEQADADAADFGEEEAKEQVEEERKTLVEIRAEAKKREQESLQQLQGKEIKEGQKVDFTYWSRARNEELKCTVDLSDGAKPKFKLYNRVKTGVVYEMQMPAGAKIVRIDTTKLGTDRTGTVALVPKFFVGELEPRVVSVEKLFELMERMAKNETPIKLKAGDKEIEFVKKRGQLTKIPKRRPGQSKVAKEEEQQHVETTWLRELIDDLDKELTEGMKEITAALETLEKVPGWIKLYFELQEKVADNYKLLKQIDNVDQQEQQEDLLGEINENLGYVTGRLRRAKLDYGEVPFVFRGLLVDLEKQREQVANLELGGLFDRIEESFFGPEESHQDVLAASFDRAIGTLDGLIDSEPSFLSELVTDLNELVDKFGFGLEAKAKEKASAYLAEEWQDEVWYSVLPEFAQEKLRAEVVDVVLSNE